MQQNYQSITWQDDHLVILDQTQLPLREIYSDVNTIGQVWDAIKKLKVRGAPAIGIAGAYGLYLGVRDLESKNFTSFNVELNRWIEYLKSSRPTAVNLSWALERINQTVYANKDKDLEEIKEIILKTAKTIHDEDKRVCKKIGENGAELVEKGWNILTHCNTGGLATGAYGTALSVILHADDDDKDIHVWVDETRPLLQGARLTAWELKQAEIPFHMITDSMAGSLMKQGKVDMVVVGADRVTANGDTANKIGTYSLAVLAKENEIPFYVALPLSTFDLETETGDEIEIEEREPEEVTHLAKTPITPKKTDAYNPAFDVTPNKYITGFITDKGIVEPDFKKNIKKLFEK
ncbi:MAG: S-methyl-5-thioribose-1-phosphate isomerase [Gracilimonas sp.]|uniref:S-methyl-5-thioribose-1-phosphate isomerase n=1 Tax=Gracilimonas TaxID=649462 RepID=UPI001B1B81B2|nr:S-methyl-5-thioribose-1-phosphate isomerase [Gracilimonas sp.]MBO6587115.1 S-methyl-5-thioribose-1-phosphate isomerase [Gracilimonas sp.]MBO6614397.1 S-methyl-5-thioribose-1-phosphate isomerase [Gracilimonas sp.]